MSGLHSRQVVEVISDGTGATQEEVVLRGVVAAAGAVTVGVWRTVAWAVDQVSNVELYPEMPPRTHE